ncbi:hypothetical protein [Burkholderia ubonensis]|uniref:hypothetical protein n=1 Tax=Burkholderia ubonensis TaxID=101571 RepID=UPI001055E1A2|nr:hypothetical protein [Burkholderia ubonensis]
MVAVLRRTYQVYGDERFVRLQHLSSSRLYNLRRSAKYRCRHTVQHSVQGNDESSQQALNVEDRCTVIAQRADSTGHSTRPARPTHHPLGLAIFVGIADQIRVTARATFVSHAAGGEITCGPV